MNVTKTTGSLYEPGSAAAEVALDQLADVLRDVGFRVHKRRSSEMTLRVYLEKGKDYPLLNPWFEPAAEVLGCEHECLVTNVYSAYNHPMLAEIDRRLDRFSTTTECAFIPIKRRGKKYYRHGTFVMPTVVNGEEIDFKTLAASMHQVRACLMRPSLARDS